MGIKDDGEYVENLARLLLKKLGFSIIFHADWIGKGKNGKWYLFEVKGQDVFEPPPFYGHGLPRRQIKARLQFQKETGVIIVLLIWDKGQKVWYYQRLDILEKHEKIDTYGSQPRRIYNIDSFRILEELNVRRI